MNGWALDIGGTNIRLTRFREGLVEECFSRSLPRDERLEAICEFLSLHPAVPRTLPTACAGRKNAERTCVVTSFYGTPLPRLCQRVKEATGCELAPLLDDDICSGHGHLASPRSPLGPDSPNTLLLTAGTGVAEQLFVQGSFLPKTAYPHLSELGLEALLRAQAWSHGEAPVEPLSALWRARNEQFPLQSVILSGRFAQLEDAEVLRAGLEPEVLIVDLPEAPALGALVLRGLSGRSE